MSVSLEFKRLLIPVFLASVLGGQERGLKIYRCHWLFDTSSTTVVNNPSSLSRCREQLTNTSYRKYCLDQRTTEEPCNGGGLWTCESVNDVCNLQLNRAKRITSIVQTDSVTTELNKDAAYTRQRHTDDTATCITTGIFAFLLGVASATTGFVILAWRHMLFCFKKERSSRPDSVGSGVYQDSQRTQDQATSQIRPMIRNPNYCQEDDRIPTIAVSCTDHQVSSKSKTSSTAYEQLQYGETASKEVTVPDDEADPSRAPSYKYIDMSRPMGTVPIDHEKSDSYQRAPKTAVEKDVEYSVVVKQKK